MRNIYPDINQFTYIFITGNKTNSESTARAITTTVTKHVGSTNYSFDPNISSPTGSSSDGTNPVATTHSIFQHISSTPYNLTTANITSSAAKDCTARKFLHGKVHG